MNEGKPNTDDILKKYGSRIEREMKGFNYQPRQTQFSQTYERFRQGMIPSFTRYEKWAKSLGNFFTMKVAEKERQKIEKNIKIANLNLSASEVVVFALSVMFLTFFGGIFLFLALWFLAGFLSFMFLFLIFVLAIFLFFYTYKTPERLALQWRLKASSQMVPAILYVVIYMKHTSNFEKAISFAAEHLQEPLALDFRKIFWDVEVGRFSTIKDSVDNYLEGWRDYSMEFIEAFHLIEGSLYEPNEERRVASLEKALQVILDGVYDKMLKYTHDVKSPLTNVYMLGIVLPTLALAILPLASTLLGGAIKWWHVLIVFNIFVPFLVFFLTQNVMFSRPGGYGETSLIEKNPAYPKYIDKRPYFIAGLICLPLLIIGLIPLFWAYTPLPGLFGMQVDYTWSEVGFGFLGESGIFGIITDSSGKVIAGPNGAISLILSLLVPISIALFFVISFKMRTQELIISRQKYKEVEKEFNSSLFQLGNRIGDGLPAEVAFGKVEQSSKGTSTEGFFKIVNENLHQLGMSLKEALFNPKRGAVIFYPSQLIATSMQVLVESVKKGLKVAARSLMSISEYVKNIKKINSRLNDLLADIISDMKSNMTFLAPMLAGIVVGLAGMITTILGSLKSMFEAGGIDSGSAGALSGAGLGKLLGVFDITKMIPTYWLQIIIGVYIIEIVFILTITLVTIKSGRDKLQATSEVGKNLMKSVFLYTIIALVAIIGLTLLGAVALAGLA